MTACPACRRPAPRHSFQCPESTVHLHTPASAAPVCGAPIPADRSAGLTAYRSDITCAACLATLRGAR